MKFIAGWKDADGNLVDVHINASTEEEAEQIAIKEMNAPGNRWLAGCGDELIIGSAIHRMVVRSMHKLFGFEVAA